MGKITLFVRNCKVQGRFSNDIVIIEQNRTVYSFRRKHEKQ